MMGPATKAEPAGVCSSGRYAVRKATCDETDSRYNQAAAIEGATVTAAQPQGKPDPDPSNILGCMWAGALGLQIGDACSDGHEWAYKAGEWVRTHILKKK